MPKQERDALGRFVTPKGPIVHGIKGEDFVWADAALKHLETGDLSKQFCYGYINVSGKVVETRNHACHADLKNWPIKQVKTIWTATPPHHLPVTNKIMLRWSAWLMNQSPWRGVMKKLPPQFGVDKGFVIDNLSLPANLIANFCVATRQPNEYPACVASWFDFCEHDCNPNLAYIFGTVLRGTETWHRPDGGHIPIGSGLSKGFAESFTHSVMHHPLQPFSTSPIYHPCNYLWEPAGQPVEAGYGSGVVAMNAMQEDSYFSFLKNQYQEKNETVKSKRMFVVPDPLAADQRWEPPRDKWYEIARAESARIMSIPIKEVIRVNGKLAA